MTTLRAILFFAGCLPLLPAPAGEIPRLTSRTLGGTEVTLPGDPKVKAYVLSFGFSHKADKALAAWDKLIAPAYAGEPCVAYYELAELQGVPGFVKPMILHGMRRALPAPEHARFMPIYQEEAALKQIVGYQQPEAAYVVVATGAGRVTWTSHALPSETEFAALKSAVSELLK